MVYPEGGILGTLPLCAEVLAGLCHSQLTVSRIFLEELFSDLTFALPLPRVSVVGMEFRYDRFYG